MLCIKRDVKMFFKDKGLFFTSLITPAILLVLYVSFLENVYRSSIMLSIPEGLSISEEMIGGLVGGQLISSLLAVCCVTVSFCSNMLMVQDKISGANKDFLLTPVKRHMPAVAYYLSTLAATLIICSIAVIGGFIYLAAEGWYLSAADVLLLLLDVLLVVMFGTALSSLINFFLSSQGQISAVGSIVSSCYGFICGAYMPISQFPEVLQKIILFLPGTYGTSLLRNHAMRGAIAEMQKVGLPDIAATELKKAMDLELYFFDLRVEEWAMYLYLGSAIVLVMGIYVLLNLLSKRSKK